MIQDVIDLRRDKWIPRRNDSKPKLINEIANDAKNEAMEQSVALSSYNRSDKREHHRSDDNKFRGGDNKSRRKYLCSITNQLYFISMFTLLLLFYVFLND